MTNYKKEGESSLAGVRQKIAEKLKNDDSRVVVGYTPEHIVRKEGDVWEENDKQWTIKNGIRQSISKLQSARMPLWCPKCGIAMSKRLDSKMYPIHGMCFDCVIKMESVLRQEGKYDEYEKNKLKKNEISYLKYTIDKFKSALNEVSNPSFVLQDGRIETWSTNIDAIKQDISGDIAELERRLKILLEPEDGSTGTT